MKWVDDSPMEALHEKHFDFQDSQLERGAIWLTVVSFISSHHLINRFIFLSSFTKI